MSVPFKFDFELECFEKASAQPGRERGIRGFVSTEHLDKQHEVLIQEGLDFGPFLKSGFFNDNHLKATGEAVGYPEFAEVRTMPDGKKGWYVEGYLLQGHEPADKIWSFAKSLERAGNPRKVGFSVEGSIVERDPDDPRVVRKAVVREVAITRCPVNDKTALETFAKSLAVGYGSPNAAPSPGNAAPLKLEALEGVEPSRPSAKKRKRIKKSEAVLLLMSRNPRLSKSVATRIVEFAIKHYPASVSA